MKRYLYPYLFLLLLALGLSACSDEGKKLPKRDTKAIELPNYDRRASDPSLPIAPIIIRLDT